MSKEKILLAVLGGAAAAAALGYLFASDNGREIRGKIMDTVDDMCNRLMSKAEDLVDNASQKSERVRQKV